VFNLRESAADGSRAEEAAGCVELMNAEREEFISVTDT
jgi:hypothetical protein